MTQAKKKKTKVITADRAAEHTKPEEDGQRLDYTVKGAPGLRLRAWQDRAGAVQRQWSVLYTRQSDGKKRRFPIGDVATMTLRQAQDEAVRIRHEARQGRDPAGERRTERAAETFADLAKSWLDGHAKTKKRSWREDERMLNHDVLPTIGPMKANQVAKADVRRVIDAIAKRPAPIQANRVLVLIRTIFNWAVRHDHVTANPASGIDKPGKEVERKRAMTPDEIRQFWAAVEGAKMEEGTRIALKLLLLSGRRANELAAAMKSEFDFGAMIWTTPGTRPMPGDRKETGMKGGKDHLLPITGGMLPLLRRAFELSGDSEWLFPGRHGKGRHNREVPIGEGAVSRAWIRARDAAGLGDVTVHDLRRTFSSVAGDYGGHDDFEIDLVTDHKDGRSQQGKRYNQAKYLAKKREVLDTVERIVLAAVAGKPVALPSDQQRQAVAIAA